MPSKDKVRRVLNAIRIYADYEYLFNALQTADWIAPLREAGYFGQPPEPEVEGQFIRFPTWPESQYLARMAGLAPQEVLAILLALPETQNVAVQENVISAGLGMPAAYGKELVPRIRKWLPSPHSHLVAERAAELMHRLAEAGEVGAALVLAEDLLGFRGAEEERARWSRNPRGHVDAWHYGQILEKHYPAIMRADPRSGFKLLCELLDAALKEGHTDEEGEDYSYIWRRTMEDRGQDNRDEAKDFLVSAIRDWSIQLGSESREAGKWVLETLRQRRRPIFARLEAYVLSARMPALLEEAKPVVFDERRAGDYRQRREFWSLVRSAFPHLAAEEQETFLAALWARSQRDEEATQGEEELSSEGLSRQGQLYECMTYLKDHLPASWNPRYETLAREFGHLDFPDEDTLTTGWRGPTSPRSSSELAALSPADLVSYLREWVAPAGFMKPSPDGLGRALSATVEREPAKYAAEAMRFRDLDPTYIRSLIMGLDSGLKEGIAITWGPVLDLASWVMNQPRTIENAAVRSAADQDPHWGWTRKAIANLLGKGLQDNSGLGIEARDQVWSIIAVLARDPDPAPDRESGGMDPYTQSINTVRGEAMHVVLRYALWVRRSLDKHGAPQPDTYSFETLPEVREVLDEHLDPSRDSSLAVRSVYGRWFPWLAMLDRGWAEAAAAKIFPVEATHEHLRKAGWDAYVSFAEPFENVLPLLKDEYANAIARLATDPAKQGTHSPAERLAEHLMVFYWRGTLDRTDQNGLIHQFFRDAPAGIRAHALETLGRGARRLPRDDTGEQVLGRLMQLWDWRLAETMALSRDERSEELAAFGEWFSSLRFPSEWAMEQLLQTLWEKRRIEPLHSVIAALIAHAESDPKRCMQALRLIVENGTDRWELQIWNDNVRKVIQVALGSSVAEARDEAVKIIRLLGAQRISDLEGLLETAGESAPGDTTAAK